MAINYTVCLVDLYCSGQKKMFEVISRTIDDDLPSALRAGINYAASPGVILPVLMLLGYVV